MTDYHYVASFAGLFYLSLYLSAKLHVLDSRGEVWKAFIVLVPTLGAALIAVSRIMDARHHPFDVISGSLIGILVAWAAYRQYFPPVTEPWHKGRAYPIRSWGIEPKMPRQKYQEMPRDHSPVELSRMPGESESRDPEYGKPSVKPVVVPQSLDQVNSGAYRHHNDDTSYNTRDHSCSSSDSEHTHPVRHESRF